MTFLCNKHVCAVDRESCTTPPPKNGPFGGRGLMSECTCTDVCRRLCEIDTHGKRVKSKCLLHIANGKLRNDHGHCWFSFFCNIVWTMHQCIECQPLGQFHVELLSKSGGPCTLYMTFLNTHFQALFTCKGRCNSNVSSFTLWRFFLKMPREKQLAKMHSFPEYPLKTGWKAERSAKNE